MMNKYLVGCAFGMALLVAGCATTSTEPPMTGDGPCNTDAAQQLVGETATESLAATALRLTGAQNLRWIPENSAVTMDYRPTRINIEYDGNMSVTAIRCG